MARLDRSFRPGTALRLPEPARDMAETACFSHMNGLLAAKTGPVAASFPAVRAPEIPCVIHDHSPRACVRSHWPQRIGQDRSELGSRGEWIMRFWIAALSVAALLVSGDAALADKRVAFVVGNAAYKNVPQLPNPAIDAKAMASVLRNVGFDVVEGTNLTRDKMTEKLLDFGKKAEGADVAVFFYAGHGIAVNGTNYLLPIDADLKSEMDVKLGAAINVDLTLEQTMADAKVKLVFLDACRDNPFAAKIRSAKATRSVTVNSGLAEMKSGEGTLIAFATGPGQTALDGDAGNQQPVHPRAGRQHCPARRRDPAGDDQGPRPGQRGDQQGPAALGPHQPDRQRLSQPAGRIRRQATPRRIDDAGCRRHGLAPASDMEVEFWRSVKDSNKAGRAQRLSHQLSERRVQGAGARPHRQAAGRRPARRDPQPDRRHRPRRPSPRKPTRSPKTRSVWTAASAATCSAASPGSASTPRRPASSTTRPVP